MKKFKYLAGLALMAVGFASCDKNELYETTVPTSQVHFMYKNKAVLDVASDTAVKIPIGVTQAMNTSRTATITVSSPTGAVAGTHYTVSSSTANFAAGQVIDSSFSITALAAPYADGERVDTLWVSLSLPEIAPMAENDSFMVVLRHIVGGCNEGAPVLSSLVGDYANTMEDFAGSAYGPYTTTITSAVAVTETTAKIGVSNIWDTGWGDIFFILDYTDPANPITSVVPGDVDPSDGGDLSATYAGQLVAVKAHAEQPTGTYSACNETFNLYLQLGISGLGYFAGLYNVQLAR